MRLGPFDDNVAACKYCFTSHTRTKVVPHCTCTAVRRQRGRLQVLLHLSHQDQGRATLHVHRRSTTTWPLASTASPLTPGPRSCHTARAPPSTATAARPCSAPARRAASSMPRSSPAAASATTKTWRRWGRRPATPSEAPPDAATEVPMASLWASARPRAQGRTPEEG